MTKEEAELLFIDRGEDSYEDYYQELLFEFKKFFMQKTPVEKLFNGKVEKLSNLNEAYSIVSDEEEDLAFKFEEVAFSNNVKDCFNQYYGSRNRLIEKIGKSTSGSNIIKIAKCLLILTDKYAGLWPNIEKGESQVKVGLEPNPMELLKSIDEFEKLGFSTFEDIHELPMNHMLVLESKRLTLLRKMNDDV